MFYHSTNCHVVLVISSCKCLGRGVTNNGVVKLVINQYLLVYGYFNFIPRAANKWFKFFK